MEIKPANFDAADFNTLLKLHLSEAFQDACSAALGREELRAENMDMFEARDAAGDLLGFAALKTLGKKGGEIKSVRTHPDHLRKGVSRALMAHIEQQGRGKGMNTLYLETHPTPAYSAAVKLYENLGYSFCGPFDGHDDSPNSVFMMKAI